MNKRENSPLKSETEKDQKLNIHLKFDEGLSEEAEDALWAQLFEILELFDCESSRVEDLTEVTRIETAPCANTHETYNKTKDDSEGIDAYKFSSKVG